MISITAYFQLTMDTHLLMSRLNKDTVTMACELLPKLTQSGKTKVSIVGAGTGEFKCVTFHPNGNPKDIEDYMEEVLNRRKDILKDSDYSKWFLLKSCQINHNSDVYDYKLCPETGEWIKY